MLTYKKLTTINNYRLNNKTSFISFKIVFSGTDVLEFTLLFHEQAYHI
jgi:hypothetical protein